MEHQTVPIKSLEQLMAWKRYVKEHCTLKEYLFFQLGLDTGANVSLLLKLKHEDLQRERLPFPVKGFEYFFLLPSSLSGKPREFVLDQETVDILMKLHEQNPNDIFLFQSESRNSLKTPRPWSRNHPAIFLSRTAKELGMTEKVGTLTLRKSFGYHVVVNGGWTLRELQRHFEMPYANMIRRYIGLTDEKIIVDGLDG